MTGIYDSGLGGLTAYRELKRLCPDENIIYLGDTARLPYGTKSAATIRRYAAECGKYLCERGIDRLLVACGTVSANALDELCESLPVPVTGVILPASERAAKTTSNGRVAVLATGATVRSGAFERTLKSLDGGLDIMSRACPLFVPLVENGEGPDSQMVKIAVEKYLSDVRDFDPDTVILGCTHYPIISRAISEFLPGAEIISSGEEAAKEISRFCVKKENGRTIFEVTDDPEGFSRNAAVFLGGEIENYSLVGIGEQRP